MVKNFTQITKGCFTKLILMLAFVLTSAGASAAEITDLGVLELNKEYTIKDFKGYTATIIPDRDGILVWETPTGAFLTVYNDAAYEEETPHAHSYITGGQTHEYEVEAGKTYYCYTDFAWNGGTFKIYFAEGLKRESISPAENTVFDIGGEGYIELNYNMAVSIDTVILSVNGKVLDKGNAFIVGRIVGIQLKGENEDELNVKGLLESGVLKAGDKMEFTFTVTALNNPDMKLEETVTYICPEQPMLLVSDNSEGFVLKSYWYPGDETGKLILTFDRNLWVPTAEKKGPVVTISYGNAESEVEGDFYHEEFYPTVDGNKLICDFTQKRRRIDDMIVTGIDYGSALIKVVNVLDENGDFASSPGKGTMGTWSWRIAHEQIDCIEKFEFNPMKKLHSDEKTIEMYIGEYFNNVHPTDEAGVLFSWEENGEAKSELVLLSTLDIQVEDIADAVTNIPVPDAVRKSEAFKVTLVGCLWADGLEHEISADYIYLDYPVGIQGVAADKIASVKYYDANGVETESFVKGVNIIKKTYTNGSVETTKIIVK